jgi:hypothetical protein
MTKDSRALEAFRTEWVGRVMLYRGTEVVVLEAANDGSQCDYDARRRAKPTGMLLVQPRGERLGAIEDTWQVSPDDLMPVQQMFYVAEDPRRPGAAFASCVDDHRFAKLTAKDVAGWIKRGATIHRVDGPTMQKMISAWKRP